MRGKRYNRGGTMGGTMNYRDGGTPSKTISDKDIEGAKDLAKGKKSDEMIKALLGESSRTMSDSDRQRAKKIVKLLNKKKTPKHRGTGPQNNAKGGVASYRRGGGVEAADKEGSRLSISMERQEDAGFSPSEADFDQQHRLAEEGIMEVGADVKIIQGHNSRASLGETEGVRGTGAMVKGTKFRGSF